MDQRAKRDRPATNPGGVVCEECGEVFIGEEWHSWCAICLSQERARIDAKVAEVERRGAGQASTTEEK